LLEAITAPKEHQQHLELAADYSKVAVAYTKVVTISTDDHHSSQESLPRLELDGPSCPIPAGRFKKTSTSRSTPTPSTTR
jgi:hypothetical protein